MNRKLAAVAAFFVAFAPAIADAQIIQQNKIVPGHASRWVAPGLLGDGGGIAGGLPGTFLTEIGTTNPGIGYCQNSGPINLPYRTLCLGFDGNNGMLSLDGHGLDIGTFELSIGGIKIPFPGTISGMPSVLSNAEMKLLSSSFAPLVVRQDYAAGNGSPAIFYSSSGSACSLNGGAGDDGAQIRSSDGGCWNMRQPPGGVYDVRIWGAKVNGSSDDSAAEIAANTAITTLYGGGVILVPATGHCMLGQGFTIGSEALGAGVIIKGAGVGACLKLKPNATGPLLMTANAYTYMTRYLTGAITQASSSIPVTDSANFVSGNTVTVIDSGGNARSAVVNGSPTPTSIPVNPATWNGSFSAPIGSWFTNFHHPGPPNSGAEDILLDGNECVPCGINNQSPVNNNIFATATHSSGALALQNSGTIRFSPGSLLLQEFYSPGDLSAITYTITCTIQRLDYTHTQVQVTFPGPNAGVRRTSTGCNGYYSSTLTAAAPTAGGSSYLVNDILTITGGTCETQPQVKVASLSGSAVATVTVQAAGICTTFPADGTAATGGTGSGATFTLTKRSDGISASADSGGATLTIGTPDGVGSLDAIAHYGPMPRYKNIIVENFRGWGMRTGFGPGVGFSSPAPSGSNWQTQEGYIENIQVLDANAGAVWFNGPNDTRITGVTANFIYGFGVWFDRMSAGTVASNLHISGGFPDGGTKVEPTIGIFVMTDSITCHDCKSEEAGENIDIFGNNAVFTDFNVFHIDDGTDRIGVKIGDGNYVPANNLTKGYDLRGRCTNMGQGCLYLVTDGGGGQFHAKVALGNNGHANYAGKPAFAGTPATCGTPGSDIDLQFVLPATGATVPLYRKPCTSWTPIVKIASATPAQTSFGEWYGDHAEFRVVLNNIPGTGDVTMNSPFGANQTCVVHASHIDTASGLTGVVNGILQGGTVKFQQSSSLGTAALTEDVTPLPFIGGTTLFGTIGPCIGQ